MRQRRHRARLNEPEAHGTQAINAARVFVQARSQAHAIRKFQAGQLDRVVDPGVAPGPRQRRALHFGQSLQGQVMGDLGVKAKQKGAGEGIGQQ